ncbi:MAG: response regulator transcription factor [Anaerolineae bacterium]|nr:response regulator transcription factor [Anaerolineae bacterium]
MSKCILIIDDDTLMTRSLAFSLQQAGFTTLTAASAEDALSILRMKSPDAILLDIGLPGMDGLEALRVFRQEAAVPIIFVTARRRELDEILGLELGADDYITKPFDTDVLLAHLKSVLRRASVNHSVSPIRYPLQVGDLLIDPDARSVRIIDKEIELAPKEFDLLLTLAQNAGNVVSVERLLRQIWGADWIGESQTIYVHVRWLREKIEQNPTHPRRLLTVKGVGYKLVPVSDAIK